MQKLFSVKIFSLLISCVLLLSLFSTVGARTYHAFFAEDVFKEGTLIGPVDVSGLGEEDAKGILLSEIENWYEIGELSLVSGDKKMKLNKREVFSFHILESIDSAVDGIQNPLLTDLKDDHFETVLTELTLMELQDFKAEELKSGILAPASNLHPGEIEIKLDPFVIVDDTNVISRSVIDHFDDESEIVKWVNEFGVVHVPANKPFSLLTLLSESGTTNHYSDQALSVIATGIYSSVLPSNFKIIERHISDVLPSYADFGYEAKIENKKKDLIIYNENPYDYKLVFSLTDEGLEVQLVGAEFPQTIKVSIEDEETFKPKIIKQYDSTLPKGKMVVKQKGSTGQVAKIYRIISESGQVDQRVEITEDYYPPIHTIEAHSIIVPEPSPNLNDSDSEENGTNLESNPPGTNNGTEGEENNNESGSESQEENEQENTDLWEDPDPMHLIKS
ncbi:G5 domain-containing protein [Fredinandcohnia salidurans]|uniref:G5 domain-containing protein n=1 Tax=Fredinandcohnia salidurans TaxID=2595041 RepID=A0ABW4MU98_9BACI|nr:G5 domain-containing protein [Fredinandcohnia onubensis]